MSTHTSFIDREPIPVPQVTYPEGFSIWPDVSDEQRLSIVNEPDFHLEELLAALHLEESPLLATFGIADPAEISARHAVVRWLHDTRAYEYDALPMPGSPSLPSRQHEFLGYYDDTVKHCPHWQVVHNLLARLGAKELPARLAVLRDTLQATLPLEDTERALAEHLTEQLENMTFIEGLATLHCEVSPSEKYGGSLQVVHAELSDCSALGHQRYSEDISRLDAHQYPAWTKEKWYKNWRVALQLHRFARWRYDKELHKRRARAMESTQIREASNALQADLVDGVMNTLNAIMAERRPWVPFRGPSSITVYTHYRYGDAGLEIHLYGIDYENGGGRWGTGYETVWEHRHDMEGEAQAFYRDLQRNIVQRQSHEWGARFYQMLRRWHPGLESSWLPIDSTLTDRRHRWFGLENLYRSAPVRDAVLALEQHRKFVAVHLTRLQAVADVVRTQVRVAKDIRSPLETPRQDAGHVLAFDAIWPVRLRMRDDVEKYHAISGIPALNGQAVCLTGAHAGGKTTTSFATLEQLWLAQSGLLTFSRGFVWNPKRVVGIVVSERELGSKVEHLLGKLTRVLQAVKGIAGKDAVLVLDELGTGTQEYAGEDLGRDVLRKLRERQWSVLFNTQIQDLAQWAHEELGANCVCVTRNHTWQQGISDGGLKEYREISGFDRVLRSV